MKKSHILPYLLLLSVAGGCGGSSVSTNPFAGSYSGNMTLDSGKGGKLNLSISNGGAATGTLEVTAPPSQAPAGGGFNFSIGTHNVTGTVGSDGTLNMTGTDAGSGAGDFTINGSMLSGGTGNVNIVAGGNSYSATISASTGGGGAITFSNGSNTNAILTAFPSNPLIFMSTVGEASAIVAGPHEGGNARTLMLLLLPDATPGSTITYTGATSNANTFNYGENGTKSWKATSGTATITARTANSFTITFNNVTMTAESDTGATGSFTINGTLTK